jgi:catechol 2,3-dioxygenase
MLDRLSHVAVGYANKRETMLQFYREVLGMIEVHRHRDLIFLSGGKKYGYDLLLGPWEAGLRCFTFQVGSHDDLTRVAANLRGAGAGCEKIDVTADYLVKEGVRSVLPSGHLMEVVFNEPGRPIDAVPLIPRPHFHGGGPVAIEHVSIDCEDVEQTVRFCEDALGFKLSEFSRKPGGPWFLSFMRCKEQHHDLGVFHVSPGWKGPALNHFAFVVPSAMELVRVADAARGIGYLLECSPGRHILGDNIFLYVRDPSGNRVEVATPLSRVDAGTPTREYDVSAHQEWSNFDAWRKDAPPISRESLACYDARKR